MFNIPSYALTALDYLESAGHRVYLVGGCVRDLLMGREPQDYDICTSALPEQTMACFQKDFRVVETGLKHGTVTVLIENRPLEITTFRVEGAYGDFRRPDKVTFVPDLERDLSRRDFTVNAMAWNPKEGLIDLFSGREDIEARLIRCVGDPEGRFSEDALRILRALRFAAALDFAIEEKTAAATFELRHLLKFIAAERIYTELKKLLSGPAAGRVVPTFAGVVEAAAGWPPKPYAGPAAADTAVAFCLYFEDPAPVLARLKAPGAVIASAGALASAKAPESLPEALGLLGRLGKEDFDRLKTYFALLGRDAALLDLAETCGRPAAISEMALTGGDLLALGVPKGPEIGRLMQALLDLAMKGEAENTKESLLAALARLRNGQ